MALETPKWLSDAVSWRWTPTLALVTGSLLYVLLAATLVPAQITFSDKPGSAASPSPGLLAPSESAFESNPGNPAEATTATTSATRSRRQRRRQALAEATGQAELGASESPAVPMQPDAPQSPEPAP